MIITSLGIAQASLALLSFLAIVCVWYKLNISTIIERQPHREIGITYMYNKVLLLLFCTLLLWN